jgi:hypothetical protein
VVDAGRAGEGSAAAVVVVARRTAVGAEQGAGAEVAAAAERMSPVVQLEWSCGEEHTRLRCR